MLTNETSLISVILPVYKVESYLEKCLGSILSQTYTNLEIILVDDGSPDNCGRICDEYAKKDNRIKVIHKENGGVSSARNAGLDIASGEYIVFVDPDDYIEVNMIQEGLNEITKEDYDILECNYHIIHMNGSVENRGIKNNTFEVYQKTVQAAFTGYISFGVISKIFKRSAINNIVFSKDVAVGEDMKFFFDCCKKNNARVRCTDKPLYNYLKRENSALNKGLYKGTFDGIYILEYMMDECSDKDALAAVKYYYLERCLTVLKEIVIYNSYQEKKNKIRKKILNNMKFILMGRPISTNGGVKKFGIKTKLNVILLRICPVIAYKLYRLL